MRLGSARLPKIPKSNLSFWRLPCPPIAPRTVPLCVRSPLPTAASAALPGPPIRISAPSTSCSGGRSSDRPARWPRAHPVSCSARLPRQAAFRESRALQGICFSRLYLGQTLVQTRHLAQHEYINAYGTDSGRETVRHNFDLSADPPSPDPQSAPSPAPAAASDSSPTTE